MLEVPGPLTDRWVALVGSVRDRLDAFLTRGVTPRTGCTAPGSLDTRERSEGATSGVFR
jgi:hypothetical protein